jgi:hypothetical protein
VAFCVRQKLPAFGKQAFGMFKYVSAYIKLPRHGFSLSYILINVKHDGKIIISVGVAVFANFRTILASATSACYLIADN